MKIYESRVESRESSAKTRSSQIFCPRPLGAAERSGDGSSLVPRHPHAFTLIELLVVLSILAILGALVVPALKNFGHSSATASATRQMLDGVARARQLAISQHTTVYMVFVPTNFWNDAAGNFNAAWWGVLTPAQKTAATNLCDKQLVGYTFMAQGAAGDQPGRHVWHYLAPWQTLPDNTFIAQWKFYYPIQPFQFRDTIDSSKTFSIFQFDYTNNIPFPTEANTVDNTPGLPWLPYIAFNYLGQLTVNGVAVTAHEYIPLARGSVLPATTDPTTGVWQLAPPSVLEIPSGNSTTAYNIIDIDPLTGRATLQQPKMQ
jgi:prepilin-type N-terminal cleavage/methylation domain-containing protein